MSLVVNARWLQRPWIRNWAWMHWREEMEGQEFRRSLKGTDGPGGNKGEGFNWMALNIFSL